MTRVFIWSVWSYFAGFMCYFVPTWAYGKGEANIYGKTEDLWTVSFAAIICNVAMHHLQLFMSIRHFTWWLILWCFISVSMCPICIICVEYLAGNALIHR